jgi:two-component system LytT family response regulator
MIAAFELGALDYLVKPFGRERLLRALERVRAHLGDRPETPGSVERALATTEPPPLARLFARQGERIVPIPTLQILRIEAKGDYAEVHTARGAYLLHITMRELLRILDPRRFEAVHRSHIVNLDAVEHMRSVDDRRLQLTLRDGSTVVASRGASERLRRQVR